MIKRVVRLCLLFCVAAIMGACQSPTELPPAAPTQPAVLPGEVISFSFSESDSCNKRVQGYDFVAEDGRYTAYFQMANENEPFPVPVDQEWADTLTGIIRQYNMLSWDGFNKYLDGLLDGTNFSAFLEFSDGTSVHARGYGLFPDGYGGASSAIDAHFLQLLPEEMRSW